MKLVNHFKLLTHPLRKKLSRLLSRHDQKAKHAATTRANRLAAQVEHLQAENEGLKSQSKSLESQLGDSLSQLSASEKARREVESALEQFQPLSWEKFHQIMKLVPGEATWQLAAAITNDVVERFIRPHHKSVAWGDRLLTLDKSMGVLREPEFQAALDTFRGVHPYDQYNGHDSISWRLNTLVWAGRVASGLEGDFVECGVFKGDMSYTVARCTGFEKLPKTFYLYDSFEGYSPKYSSAADFPFNPNFIDTANKAYRIPGLYETVCKRFADYSNVRVIRGFLPDALELESHKKVAFLHVDLNSPAAEVGCLKVLFERVVPGGIIVLDDYGWIDFTPQMRAGNEFFSQHGHLVLELPTGQGLVVKQ